MLDGTQEAEPVNLAAPAPAQAGVPPIPSAPSRPPVDSIKVEYHPKSGKEPVNVTYAFEDFTRDQHNVDTGPADTEPWRPAFNSRLDFDFAELTHETHMNKGQIKKLLKIVQEIVSNKEAFTFTSVDDVDHAWAKAQVLYPSVRSSMQ